MQPRYQLVHLANGTRSIRSLAEHETFHPVAGPAVEAEALYVRQLGLVERMAARRDEEGEFVIWDVGLGAAANVLTALSCAAPLPARVRVVSFDRTLEPLTFALGHAEALGYLRGFEDAVTELLARGETEFTHGALRVRWQAQVGEFPEAVAQAVAQTRDGGAAPWPAPGAVFFDAYSPSRNPEMWTLPLFSDLRTLIGARPCQLATYSRSTRARVTLLLGGFFVGVGESLAGKEETTVAATAPEFLSAPLGHDWLARARRSHNAEPLRAPRNSEAPLAPETWEQLQAHPQFSRG